MRFWKKKKQQPRLVVTDVKDDDGRMWRAVETTDEGGLAILGHDLGPGVERFYGVSEYEFERRFSADEAAHLRRLLELQAGDDLLAAIAERFASTSDLETFAKEHGIEGTFWNRVGN